MCAEAVWWRCHRRIIADYLLAAGEQVMHILGTSHVEVARLTPGAVVRDDGTVVYPAESRSDDVMTVADRQADADALRGLQPPKAMRKVAMIPTTARP